LLISVIDMPLVFQISAETIREISVFMGPSITWSSCVKSADGTKV